ncbi:DUF4158 domain-containing protein [Streptomyces rimosus]
MFLDEPTDIPVEVADYLAEQLGIEYDTVPNAYGERENTRLDHVRELRQREYREFAEVGPGARPQPGSLAVHGSSGGRAGSVRLVPAYPSAHVRSACRWS